MTLGRLGLNQTLAHIGVVCAAGWIAIPASAEGPRAALVLRHGGIDQLMPDANDAQLRAAMHMLSLRLAEVPGEIARLQGGGMNNGEVELAQRLLPMFASLAEYPTEFAVIDQGINDLGVPDVDVRLVVHAGDAGRAASYRDAISGAIKQGGGRIPLTVRQDDPGMLQVQTPVGLVMFGVPKNTTVFTLGLDFGGDGLKTDMVALDGLAELGGHPSAADAYVDAQALADIAERFVTMFGGAQGTAGFQQARSQYLGTEPVRAHASIAFIDDRMIAVTRSRGMGMPGANGAAEPTIPMDLLRMIPEDARYASAYAFDVGGFFGHLAQMTMGMSNVGFVQVQQATGFNPLTDLIQNFGPLWLTYTSDTTGGGGILSTVCVNSGVKREALQATLDRVTTLLGSAAAQVPYVRVRTIDAPVGGAETHWYRVTFPGVPVPVEVNLALQQDRLVAGLTTQALEAALAHASSGTPSLLDNSTFAKDATGRLDNLHAIGFIDTPRTLDRGYPLCQILGTALQNLVRSPADETRDPGLVTPSFAMIAKGARPTTWVTRSVNGERISVMMADASWMTNLAGWSGATNAMPLVAAAGVATGIAAAERHHRSGGMDPNAWQDEQWIEDGDDEGEGMDADDENEAPDAEDDGG